MVSIFRRGGKFNEANKKLTLFKEDKIFENDQETHRKSLLKI